MLYFFVEDILQYFYMYFENKLIKIRIQHAAIKYSYIAPIGMDHEKSGENQDFRSKTGKTGHF